MHAGITGGVVDVDRVDVSGDVGSNDDIDDNEQDSKSDQEEQEFLQQLENKIKASPSSSAETDEAKLARYIYLNSKLIL